MSKVSKLAYLIVLGGILYPVLQHWDKPIEIPHKQALLPPAVPAIPKPDEQLLNALLAHNLWEQAHQQVSEKKPSEDGKTAEPIQWVLQAVNPQQPEASAVITYNGQQKRYHVGDKLPRGEQLTEILSDGIIIKQQEKTKRVYLFGKK